MTDATKRVNFFDRQFLRAPDFQDEQAYHLDRRQRHNRLLHSPGVAEGLAVSGNVGGTFVTVASGTAYDELGHEMVLSAQQQVLLPAGNGTAYVTIAYFEQTSDPSNDPGVTGKATRMSEIPALATSLTPPANPNLSLLLATVAVANGTVNGTPDNTVRAHAGAVVGDDLTVRSLTLKRDGVISSQWPKLICSQAKQATLQASDLTVEGNVGIGVPAPTQKLEVVGTVKATAFQGDGSALTGVSATDNTKVAKAGDTMTGTLSITADGTGLSVANNAKVGGTLTAGGNVGIGTTAPTQKLHVVGNVQVAGNTTTPLVTVTQSGTTGNPVGLSVSAIGAAVDGIGGVGLRGTANSPGGFGIVGSAGPAGSIAGQFNGDIAVANNAKVGGTLTVGGNVGIGQATPARNLHVEGTEIHSGGDGGGFSFANRETGSFVGNPPGGERWVWYASGGSARLWSGTDKVKVTTDGVIHATSVAPISDARFKTNIKPLKSVLEKLEKIRAVSFDWNELYASLGRSTGRREIGVIAQEVEAVFPELVTTWSDQGYKGVDYGRLTAVLLEAVKELRAANKVLEERFEALEDETRKGKPRPRLALGDEVGA